MSLVVASGSELIRYNPSKNAIEVSKSRGMTWFKLRDCSGMGNVRALTEHKGKLLLCSSEGVYCSEDKGFFWRKLAHEKDFVDLRSMGSEVLAITSAGKTYLSRDGFTWFRRG